MAFAPWGTNLVLACSSMLVYGILGTAEQSAEGWQGLLQTKLNTRSKMAEVVKWQYRIGEVVGKKVLKLLLPGIQANPPPAFDDDPRYSQARSIFTMKLMNFAGTALFTTLAWFGAVLPFAIKPRRRFGVPRRHRHIA